MNQNGNLVDGGGEGEGDVYQWSATIQNDVVQYISVDLNHQTQIHGVRVRFDRHLETATAFQDFARLCPAFVKNLNLNDRAVQ